ncbi:MAG: hypothetical protein CUN49_07785 [Candidatus Thermofonsia Clade 1 bacterium]|jgi:hypothetical protein|uniref:Uncharacterized protein n=1 Tax=Candidatus Thermofonsia Clade 1 bacterium TaxID=2364210 RepID=A0A2M8PEK3_9CHLR|nr:MAG: hypothetical protein CUN49_07785 [Candidatus Thermofonsia Clade 1 bacterium]RMF50662.1 MAG: hypothetical protein D6749_09990 [Chloroflexota bacterium]
MRLPLAALMVACALAALLGAARSVGAARPQGALSGCLVYFQRFAISRHGVYYWVTHHDLASGMRLESKPVPALERRYQSLAPDKRYMTAARLESLAAYYGDHTFRLVLRPYGRAEEIVLAENIRVHNPLHMTPAVWTAWTADSRWLYFAWQTPLGQSFLAAYDLQRKGLAWQLRTDGRATYRLLTLRDAQVNAERLVRALNHANFYRLPCAPVLLHPNESD